MEKMREQILTWWQAERSRKFLWLPVCFGLGIAIYLGLPVEPSLYVICMFGIAVCVAALALWSRATALMVALVLVSFGIGWTYFMTHLHRPVVLYETLEARPVVGIVRAIERTEHGVRLTLGKVNVDGLAPELTPKRIRLSVRLKKDSELALPHIGDAVGMRATLLPPMGPVMPRGFDFARYFYFKDIGAVGYGLPPWHVIGAGESDRFASRFMNWRVGLSEDIIKTLGRDTGPVAAGLITGDARAISETRFEELRSSNLYHIIAISGEHMVVIAGVIFITLRLLSLAVLPVRVRLRPEIKTVTALITLALVTVYLFVTGLPISAIRAYVMIFLVLLAVILRRQVDPMRSLSITAFLMLLVDPANLLDPGFQLSFAATLAIIALVESRVLKGPVGADDGRLRRWWSMFVTVLLISVVAEAATAPLVIALFNNASPYGVFANMLATPVMSLFLMPTVALYFILLPLGLGHVALWLMNQGIHLLLGIAHFVSQLPHAQLFAPSLPGYGVGLFVIGLLWLCLWRTRARRLGFVAIAVGIATISIGRAPDMLVGGQLKQVVLRTNEGYALARGRSSSMIPSMWAHGLGYDELPEAGAPYWRCDKLGCVTTIRGNVVALSSDAAALTEDCARAKVVMIDVNAACATDAIVLDQESLRHSGAAAVWFEKDGSARVEMSRDWQGNRPWSAGAVDEE